MIVSGHQPVYLPWLGLFHKLSLCDVFVYMDTVQYLENDWNNRNKIRTPQGWSWLTVPIDHRRSQGRMLDQIIIKHDNSSDHNFWQLVHWRSLEANYRKAPFFDMYSEQLREMYLSTVWERLIDLCWAQFKLFCRWLGIEKKIVRMSEYRFEGTKDRLVLDHCQKLAGDAVVFGSQGKNYVNTKLFTDKGIRVYFQEYRHPVYEQRFPGFESHMCILDLLFNRGDKSKDIVFSDNISYAALSEGSCWINSNEINEIQ
jgi:hypothetical protein